MNDPSVSAEPDARLIEVLDDYLARLQAGEAPNKQQLLAAHPDLAGDLEACLESLDFVCTAAVQRDPDAMQSDAADLAPAVGVLGDFRIIREIGRGGMGVVYEAEQLSLGRRVALKVLPFASVLDSKQLTRFKNEAQAAAHLHHNNIVPVFAVGCERAVHYYAMQFIDGQTLADVIRELAVANQPKKHSHDVPGDTSREPSTTMRHGPAAALRSPSTVAAGFSTDGSKIGRSYYRATAEIGAQVAEAIEYAHQMGVIHRDIKPSNLLLDNDGKVWITDFGLAQFQSDAGLTMTGDLLGTLRYMSPEAASGNSTAVDHRADIYSLSLTLYELLAFRPAFGGNDRPNLLRRIASDDPPPPRRFNHSVPAELETIVLKGMSKEPGLRYATGRELAEDLQRYLQDKPIMARRPSLVQRGTKFARRHRGMVATAVVSLTILLLTATVGASVVAIWLGRERNVARGQQILAEERLLETLLTQAAASRQSNRAGRQFESQRAVQDAARLATRLALTDQQRLRLRNEAVASMAVTYDLREIKRWPQSASDAAIDFAPDFKHYARSDAAGMITVRRLEDNSIVATLEGLGRIAGGLRFSPDGRFLFAQYDKNVCCLWDVSRKERVLQLPSPPSYVGCDFSPDGALLAIGQAAREVHLFELPSGRHVRTIALAARPECVCFHPDSKQVFVSMGRMVECRDVESGALARQLPQPGYDRTTPTVSESRVHRMALSPDGANVLTVLFNRARVWNMNRGEEPFSIAERAGFYQVAFNSRADLIGATTEGGVTVWDALTGESLVTTHGQFIRFSGEGRRVAFLGGDWVGVAKVVEGDVYRTLVPDSREQNLEVAVSHRWPLIASAAYDGMRIWSPLTRRELAFLPVRGVVSVKFHDPSSSLMISTHDGLYRWPISESGHSGRLRIGPPGRLDGTATTDAFQARISLSPNERYLARCVGSVVRIFDLESTTELHGKTTCDSIELDVRRHPSVFNVSVSDDRKWVVTGTAHGEDVWLWDVAEARRVRKLWEGRSHSASKFSPDGKSLVVISNTEYQLFDVETWTCRWRIARAGSVQWPRTYAFSPDSAWLAIELSGALRIVDTLNGREVFSLQGPGQRDNLRACFSPDGRQIVELNREFMAMWDLDRIRARLNELELHLESPKANPQESSIAWEDGRRVDGIELDLGDLFNKRVAGAYFARAYQFDRDGLHDDAVREYEKAVAAYPDDALTCNNLAWLYATAAAYLREPDRALELAGRVAELEPENPDYLNTLGVARYRGGQWQAAIETLRKNIELDSKGGTAFDFFFLAMSYHQTGDVEKAQEYYDQAVNWWNAQSKLPDSWHQELVSFRAEANALFKSAAQ